MQLLRGVEWGESAVALHSLNLAEMEYKRWGEIDFVLIGRPGILVIEVKGGDVSCEDGVWRYKDGYGRVVKRHDSPLVQSKDAYFALMTNYLNVRFGREFDDIPTGFCAILAGAPRKSLQALLGGPEFPSDLLGGQREVSDKGQLQAFLRKALLHWAQRGRGKRGTLADSTVKEVVSYLRPSFERVQPLSLSLTSVRQELVELTRDQYNCLDHWEGAKRLFVTGPAGCGKTFIAVEMAQRAAASGARVLFVAGTDGLARGLALQAFPKGVTLSAFSTLQGLGQAPQFDLLIVDEGQLALSDETLEQLRGLLEGGLANGRWAWFGDPTYQGVDSESAVGCVERLCALADVAPRLLQNCRNTPQVVAAVELCSGAPIGHALVKGAGPAVEYREAHSASAVPSLAAAQIEKWLAAGIGLHEILLLLGRGNAPAIVAEVGRIAGVPVFPWHDAQKRPPNALRWASVEEFRGLESPFVLLTGLEQDLTDASLQRLLYAGMSRPNLGLAVAATSKTMDRIRAFNTATLARQTGT